MNEKHGDKSLKKKYEKPQLRVINIAPGVQTLGIGCKLAASGMSYEQPCVSMACASTPGS